MNEKDLKKIIDYWQETAKRDYYTMTGLFGIKRYPESLFYGHIVLEKVLKRVVTKKTKNHTPFTHDLEYLAKLSKLDFTKEEQDLLSVVNEFNIRARYPERKMEFYKICNKQFTEKYIKEIKKLYKKLCLK